VAQNTLNVLFKQIVFICDILLFFLEKLKAFVKYSYLLHEKIILMPQSHLRRAWGGFRFFYSYIVFYVLRILSNQEIGGELPVPS